MSVRKMEKQLFFVMCAAAAAALPAADAVPAAGQPEGRDSMARSSVAMQEKVQDFKSGKNSADALVDKANEAFCDGKFEEAKKLYLEAVSAYRKAQESISGIAKDEYAKKIRYCQLQIIKSYRYMARNAKTQAEEKFEAKRYDEAIALLRTAAELSPEDKDDIEKTIARYNERRRIVQALADSNESTIMPDRKDKEYQIQLLIRQGMELAAAGKYDLALRKFKEVQLIDPFNAAALQNALAMSKRMGYAAEQRTNTAHRRAKTEMSWKWATPIYPEAENSNGNELDNPEVKVQQQTSILKKKLDSIRISKIELSDVSIPTAIRYLREESKRNDPEGVGINIVLLDGASRKEDGKSGQENANAANVAAEEEEEGPAVVSDSSSGSNANSAFAGQKISLEISNRSLRDAIQEICKVGKLEHRVEKYAVVIAPADTVIDTIETRLFPLDPSLLQGKETPEELQQYFEGQGISFPAGAKIVLDKRISRLIATNTVENLNRLEELIEGALMNKEPLVEISAKFVEVSENDLKQLGFNYTLNYNPDNNPYTAAGSTTGGGSSMVTPGNSSHRLSFKDNDQLNSSMLTLDGSTSNLISVGGFFNDGEGQWTATINAVNQADSKDILSSPRVVTLPDHTAYIEMVLETYYADTYTNGTNTINSGSSSSSGSSSDRASYTSVSPMPNFTDPTPLGIRMEICPKVDKERRLIIIDEFAPVVTAFSGYTEYSTVDSSGNKNMVRKPIIDVRDISTSLTIYDGQTVVVGSVIDDRIETIDDRYPILGDLPLIGRFFQSKGTKATKRSLLVFITCRLIKPDGSPFFPNDVRNTGFPKLDRQFML